MANEIAGQAQIGVSAGEVCSQGDGERGRELRDRMVPDGGEMEMVGGAEKDKGNGSKAIIMSCKSVHKHISWVSNVLQSESPALGAGRILFDRHPLDIGPNHAEEAFLNILQRNPENRGIANSVGSFQFSWGEGGGLQQGGVMDALEVATAVVSNAWIR
eukprot:766862-Hanusia_phi.AAC.3